MHDKIILTTLGRMFQLQPARCWNNSLEYIEESCEFLVAGRILYRLVSIPLKLVTWMISTPSKFGQNVCIYLECDVGYYWTLYGILSVSKQPKTLDGIEYLLCVLLFNSKAKIVWSIFATWNTALSLNKICLRADIILWITNTHVYTSKKDY